MNGTSSVPSEPTLNQIVRCLLFEAFRAVLKTATPTPISHSKAEKPWRYPSREMCHLGHLYPQRHECGRLEYFYREARPRVQRHELTTAQFSIYVGTPKPDVRPDITGERRWFTVMS